MNEFPTVIRREATAAVAVLCRPPDGVAALRSAMRQTLLCGLLIAFTPDVSLAVTYPYTIPGPVTATLDVNTSIRVPVDPMQLCVNYDPYDSVSLQGFNHSTNKDHFRTINPSGVRWPQGVWANFYDWESDGRRIFDNYQDTYYGAVVNVPQLKYGFDGLHELHDELNFDVLFTWNICYDSVAKGMARYNDRVSKGFDFRWVELGNENFYKDQRSDAILDPQNYPPIASAHSQALKAADPNILISVPAAWKTFTIPLSFTNAVAADQSYYDAVSLHKYMNGSTLDATGEMQGAVDYIKGVYPGKPIWLTEWSVNSSGDNALGALGTAEIYLYFFNRMDEITMNQNFQVFGGGNFYDSNFMKTPFGSSYEIVRSVFADSEMYSSTCTSTEITGGINAVLAEAVDQDGKTVIFAINKANVSAPFTLQFDGITYTGNMKHQALAFSGASDFPLFGFTEDPLTTLSSNTTSITLPPLSLNVITLLDSGPAVLSEITIEAENAVAQTGFTPYETRYDIGGPTYVTTIAGTTTTNFDSVVESRGGVASYPFELLQAGDVTIEANGRFDTTSGDAFWYKVDNGSWVRKDVPVGGPWKWTRLLTLPGMAIGSHTLSIARRDAETKLDRFRLTSTTGLFNDPLRTTIAIGGTTRIEAEDYAPGGEGIGYHDTTPGNTGNVYRNENVDIRTSTDTGGGFNITSVTAGEWLKYPIHVAQAGPHRLRMRVARSQSGDGTLRVLSGNTNLTGTLTVPGNSTWTNLEQMVDLDAGKQDLMIKFTTSGIDLNYLEISSLELPAPWVQADIGAVAAAGTAEHVDGSFTVVGSGSDVWLGADEFNFVHLPSSDDCEILARVASMDNTHTWAKAGVMIRDTLAPDAKNASVFVTPGQGVTFQRRTDDAANTSSTVNTGLTAPFWLKVKRVGNTFTGYRSVDGIAWTTIGTATIAMGNSVYLGLAVTSHNDGVLCTAEFDNVSYSIPAPAPLANAGADQFIQVLDGNFNQATTLNGTASTTPTGTITSYVWTEGSTQIATGPSPTVSLATGTHPLTLTVTNSLGASHTDTVVISVSGLAFSNLSDASPQSNNSVGGTATDPSYYAGQFNNVSRSPVFVFELPDLGAIANPFTSASASFDLTSIGGTPAGNVDLYGLGKRALPTVLASDYWADTTDADASDASLLQDNLLVPTSMAGIKTSADLAAYLNTQYASGAGANQFVFLRLSTDADLANSQRYFITSANGAASPLNTNIWPRLNYTIVPLPDDADLDGMPDNWERQNFGSLTKAATADDDGDGVSNRNEYIAGTLPTDSGSRFAILSMIEETPGSGQFTLRWPSVAGRTYMVLKSTQLDDPDWPSVSETLEGTGGELSFTAPPSAGDKCFYKVQVNIP